MYQLYDKNRDRSGTGAKPVKNGFFFHQDRLFFCQKQLAKPLETRVYPSWRPGCGRGADPGLCEVFTGMRGCLSAMLEVLLCLVLASFLPMAVFWAVNGKYGKAFPHPYAPSHTYGVHRRTGQDEDAYVVSPAQSTG